MKGIYISHWQGVVEWDKIKKDGVEFAILKCTQGTDFIDSHFLRNKEKAREQGILLGYYHFADGGDPVREADHFLKQVGDLSYGEFVVLDWEIAHPRSVAWCSLWLNHVESKLGFKPLIYLINQL
jgi:lysozyme